jgi:hypothetical protein
LRRIAMKRILALTAVAFALITGAVAVVTVSSEPAFACKGDYHGS